jgi:hypothetical protein
LRFAASVYSAQAVVAVAVAGHCAGCAHRDTLIADLKQSVKRLRRNATSTLKRSMYWRRRAGAATRRNNVSQLVYFISIYYYCRHRRHHCVILVARRAVRRRRRPRLDQRLGFQRLGLLGLFYYILLAGLTPT